MGGVVGPASDLEDVVQQLVGQWVRSKLTHGAQIAQKKVILLDRTESVIRCSQTYPGG